MTLDQAIATHPALWDLMGEGHRADPDSDVLRGMVIALGTVGNFAFSDIRARLAKDFG